MRSPVMVPERLARETWVGMLEARVAIALYIDEVAEAREELVTRPETLGRSESFAYEERSGAAMPAIAAARVEVETKLERLESFAYELRSGAVEVAMPAIAAAIAVLTSAVFAYGERLEVLR